MRETTEVTLKQDIENVDWQAVAEVYTDTLGPEDPAQLERLPALVERIYSKGSQGKQRIRHAEAQQLVVDAFDLVSSLDALAGLEPVQVKPSNAG